MKNFRQRTIFIVSLSITLTLLAGCGQASAPKQPVSAPQQPVSAPQSASTAQPSSTDQPASTSHPASTDQPSSTEQPFSAEPSEQAASEEVSAPESPQPSTKNNHLIKHHNEHKYTHGEDGYYNLLDDGIDFELTAQLSGTCWICASICAMKTAYQFDHDETIELDQLDLLNQIYSDDKEEGVFIVKGADKEALGGSGIFVTNELANGFSDGLVLDSAIVAQNWTMDEIKEGIKRYGALYIGIPDPPIRKGTHDNYFTMNCPEPKDGEFDHSIAVLGWDDSFPKEYFNRPASQDGAWITYNSNYSVGYFYVSYDTPFDQLYDIPLFLSVTDGYSKVLAYDCGQWLTEPVITGDTTTTANVFKEKGTLAAVGTYAPTDDTDLTIKIMTPDMEECLFSQECHAEYAGYYVFDLEIPIEVDEYAIAVTYPKGAPVEGKAEKLDTAIYTDVTSKSGQSFILLDGKWLDMSEEQTWNQLGCETNNACIKALYVD